MSQPHEPTIADFKLFAANNMGITTTVLPANSPYYDWAFGESMNIVNTGFAAVCGVRDVWSIYQLAVYNLAGHYLIEFAPDQSFQITAAAWANNLTTLTTAVNTLTVGEIVKISGVSPLAYAGPPNRGVVQINSIIDDQHLNYALSPNPGTSILAANAAVIQTFFSNVRKQWKINSFVPGLIASTSDLTTSVAIDNPDFMKGLTFADLQLAKTPWGRTYLAIAQKAGQNLWGLA